MLGPYRSIKVPIDHIVMNASMESNFFTVFTSASIDTNPLSCLYVYLVKSQEVTLGMIRKVFISTGNLKKKEVI